LSSIQGWSLHQIKDQLEHLVSAYNLFYVLKLNGFLMCHTDLSLHWHLRLKFKVASAFSTRSNRLWQKYIVKLAITPVCQLKSRVQERPLDFWPFWKCSKIAEFWHVGFVLPEKHCSEFFFGWGALRSREITYAKSSVFQAASFGDLLSNKKQKKPYYFVEQQTGRLFIVYSTES